MVIVLLCPRQRKCHSVPSDRQQQAAVHVIACLSKQFRHGSAVWLPHRFELLFMHLCREHTRRVSAAASSKQNAPCAATVACSQVSRFRALCLIGHRSSQLLFGFSCWQICSVQQCGWGSEALELGGRAAVRHSRGNPC